MPKIIAFLLVLFFSYAQAQELNCTVKVNADKVGGTNTQVFKTLEKSLSDFVNKNNWTSQVYKNNERINCSMFITVSEYNSGQFSATIQVQSSRPIFDSTYSSPVFNFNDKDFNFDYVEFQNLTFNPTTFESNLISVVAFYSYLIIGMDADTFKPKGGDQFYALAQEVVNVAQAGGYKGWSQNDGNQNRYFLSNDLFSETYAPYREAMYKYHFQGMDSMSKDLKTAKEKIKVAIAKLSELHKVRPNAFLTRVFFDAKSDEIVSVFSGGPKIPIVDLVENLNKVSPLNSSKWAQIKF
ncbi:MAG: DUF4835 family protein [Burkholderiales bacterium]|nr:DUF4835 family protein [Flavobacterium sp.]